MRVIRDDRSLSLTAHGAAALAFLHAAVSAYWAAGGTVLLDTVGGGIAEFARSGAPGSTVVLAAVVLVKLAGGALALALVQRWGRRLPRRLLIGIALAGGAVLVLYGGVKVLVGGVALTGMLGPVADPLAVRWHVLLWGPSFLLWGCLLTFAAVRRARPSVRSGV